jgi:hypothetical protein
MLAQEHFHQSIVPYERVVDETEKYAFIVERFVAFAPGDAD